MRPVAPRIGHPEITIAEDQEEFYAITGAIVTYGDGTRAVFTRWRLTEEERAKIAAGEDLYLSIMGRMVPVKLCVGTPEEAI